MVPDVLIPNAMDVLCGRGSTCYKHPGNQHFRVLIAVHLPIYGNPQTSRKNKTLLIRNIVQELQDGRSRFLREGPGGWYHLSRNEVKAKVGHAMRDAGAEMKRHLRRKQDKGIKIMKTRTNHRIEKEEASESARGSFEKSLEIQQSQPESLSSLCLSWCPSTDNDSSDFSTSVDRDELDFLDCFDFENMDPGPKKPLGIQQSQPESSPSLCPSGCPSADDDSSDFSTSVDGDELDFSDCFDFKNMDSGPKKSLLIENSLSAPVAGTAPDRSQLIQIINQSA